MSYIDTSMNFNHPAQVSPKSKRVGATILGGLLGMTCYYLPINKDTFVNTAFRVSKRNAQKDMKTLQVVADEISKNKLSNESKIFLTGLGVGEDISSIASKCSEIKDSITDKVKVTALKKEFADNFKNYKKDGSLMDTVTSKAMITIKWNGFKWGMGIGALLGAALSLLMTRDKE